MKSLQTENLKDLMCGQVVCGSAAITELAQDWDDLFNRAVGAPPYLSRFWVKPFVETGKLSGEIVLIVARYDGKLIALLPVSVRRIMGVLIAEPLGSGEPSYLGLLLDPDYNEAVEYIAGFIKSEKVLQGYGCQRLSFTLNFNTFFGLQCLM